MISTFKPFFETLDIRNFKVFLNNKIKSQGIYAAFDFNTSTISENSSYHLVAEKMIFRRKCKKVKVNIYN